MRRKLLGALSALLLVCGTAGAQGPMNITYTVPDAGATEVSASLSEVRLVFDQAIYDISGGTFIIYTPRLGSLPVPGTFNAPTTELILHLVPAGISFEPGEQVEVRVLGTLYGAMGTTFSVAPYYTLSFGIAGGTPPGVISGQGQLANGRGFDFSMGSVVADTSGAADVAYTMNEGTNFGNEQAPQIPGPMIYLLGYGSIDTVTQVPEFFADVPWINNSWHWPWGTAGQPLSSGQLWAVHTREGNYAVIQILQVVPFDPGAVFNFNFKYQPDGSRFFGTAPPPSFAFMGSNPANGDTGVAQSPMIWAFFDADLDPATDVSKFSVDGSQSGTVQNISIVMEYSAEVRIVLPAGFQFFPGEMVTVGVDGHLRNAAGDTLSAPAWFSFRIAGGGPPPPSLWIVRSEPENGAQGLEPPQPTETPKIFVLFDHDIADANMWAKAAGSVSDSLQQIEWGWSADTVGFKFDLHQFAPYETVSVTVGGQAWDSAGNTWQGPYTFSFTMGDTLQQQQLFVNWTEPSPGTGGVATHPIIKVHYNKMIDPGTVSLDDVRIWGQQSGIVPTTNYMAYVPPVDPYAIYIELLPFFDFQPGEMVSVTVERTIAGTDGSTPSTQYNFSFSIAAPPQGIVRGGGYVDDDPLTGAGRYFSFPGNWSSDDTTGAFIAADNKYGPSLTGLPMGARYAPLGYGPIDTINVVPDISSGQYYTPTYASGSPTQYDSLHAGQLWAVHSRGTYAVIRIVKTVQQGVIPGLTVGIGFQYKWQPNGTTDVSDYRPPFLLTGWTPTVPDTGIAPLWNAEYWFNDGLNPESIPGNVSVTGSVSGPIAFNHGVGGGYLNVNPRSPSALGERISITLGPGVQSWDGRPLANDTTLAFTIRSTPIRPQVTSTYPNEWTPTQEISRFLTINASVMPGINPETLSPNSVIVISTALEGPIPDVQIDYNQWSQYTSGSINIHPPALISGDSITVVLTDAIAGLDGAPLIPYAFGFRVRDFEPIRVAIPDSTFEPGTSFVLPVRVLDDVTNVQPPIVSFQFEAWYDTSVVRLDSVTFAGTLVENWGANETNEPWSGRVLVSGATAVGSDQLSGSGPIAYLHFTHNTTWNYNYAHIELNGIDGQFFNENQVGPPAQTWGGQINFVRTNTVQGTVSYFNSGAPVDSVRVYIWNGGVYSLTDGGPNGWGDSAMTDANGHYRFANVPSGGYNIGAVVEKAYDRSAIGAMDASYVLQNVVDIREFAPLQGMASDVSNNSQTTAYDAAHILGFVVGSLNAFPREEKWLFDWYENQGPRWIEVWEDSVNFDMQAIQLGDVNGSWHMPLAKPAGRAREAGLTPVADGLRLRLEAGEPIYAATMTITAATPVDVAEVTSADGWSVAWKADGTTLRIALAGATPIADPTDLVNIRFAGATPAISTADLVLNDGAIGSNLRVGMRYELALAPATPNPFNPSTQLAFTLPEEMRVRLVVSNALGQTVRVLVDESLTAGEHRIAWNGKDAAGRMVASGTYFVSLRAGNRTLAQRVTFVR